MPHTQRPTKRLLMLGSTGSIGTQTLDVVRHLNALPDTQANGVPRFDVVGLAAGKNTKLLRAQARELGVRDLALADDTDDCAWPGANVRRGADSAERLVREVDADLVLAAMVGFAGLPATLAACELGRDVLLANKETLVAAGELVVACCGRTGAALLPVDSEHSGVWQCLASRSVGAGAGSNQLRPPLVRTPTARDGARGAARALPDVAKVILTASGGAFRDLPDEALDDVTPEQALDHPVWEMGAKVTIDSASLTNKALELIEAHWLFGLEADRLDAVIHPTSTVHAVVSFVDGSLVAQLGAPDMRTPIQCALGFPARAPGLTPPLDFAQLGTLEFRSIDRGRYPAIDTAYRVMDSGGTAGAIFNGANEAAVEAFLEGKIAFTDIAPLGARALDAVGVSPARDMRDIVEADTQARVFVRTQAETEPAPAGRTAR